MARRRDLAGLPDEPSGLTMTDLARALSARLGRAVTPQDVYAAAIKPERVPVGRAERMIVQQPRREAVLVVPSRYVGDVEVLVRAHLERRSTAALDDGGPSG